MSFLLSLSALARKMRGAIYFSALVFFSMGNAQAITINFDDLDPDDLTDAEGRLTLTNEYQSQGVVFQGGAYLIGLSTKSLPNYVTGPGFTILFPDVLPTYVSMYVGSTLEYQVGISVYGIDGYIEQKITDGAMHGMQGDYSTPYRPDQFVSFYMPQGISYIQLGGQADTYIDDLSFTVSVPESGTLILFCLGLVMTYLQRKRLQKTPS